MAEDSQNHLKRKGLVSDSRTPEDINNGVSAEPSYLKSKPPLIGKEKQ
jgi:hypothetical protein